MATKSSIRRVIAKMVSEEMSSMNRSKKSKRVSTRQARVNSLLRLEVRLNSIFRRMLASAPLSESTSKDYTATQHVARSLKELDRAIRLLKGKN